MNGRNKRIHPIGTALSAVSMLLLVLSGCDGCGTAPTRSPIIEVVSKDASVAMTTTNIQLTASSLRGFFEAATKEAGPIAASVETATQQQVGFDVFDAEAYASAGIDPAAGLAFFAEGSSRSGLLALRVTSEEKATEWLNSLFKRVQGAGESQEGSLDGVSFRTIGRPFGTEFVPVTHFAFVRDYLLVAQEGAQSSLASAVKRLESAEAKSNLTDDPTYTALMGKVSADATMSLFVRGDVLEGTAAAGLSKGAVIAASFGESGLAIDAYFDARVEGLKTAFAGPAPKTLVDRIGADAVLMMMTQSATAEALPALRKDPTLASVLDSVFLTFEREAGMSAEKDLLPLLVGPLTGALYIEDPQRVLAMVQQQGANPSALLDAVHAGVTADVKDRARMVELLDAAKLKLEHANLSFKKIETERNGRALVRYEPDRPEPKLGWALYGDTYVYGAGSGRLDTMLDVIDGKLPSLSLEGTAGDELAARKGAAVAILRFGILGDKVGAMSAALGAGGAAMFGQLVTSAVSVAKTVGDFALAAEVDGDGIRLSIREKLGQ